MALRFGCTAVFLLAATFAAAAGEPISPQKATEMLARSQAINNKCHVLSADERQELSDIVARAEIALAEKVSVMAARTALARGRQSGVATICDEAAAKLVHDILIAAKSASALDRVDDRTVVPVVKPEPKTIVALAEPEMLANEPATEIMQKAKAAQKVQSVKATGGYAALAENYYRELRCKRLSFNSVNAMYKRVLAAHKAAVAAKGRPAVRLMLQSAKSRSANSSC